MNVFYHQVTALIIVIHTCQYISSITLLNHIFELEKMCKNGTETSVKMTSSRLVFCL